MRQIGMSAVQTALFPDLDGPEVQRLNQLPPDTLRGLPRMRQATIP